jgi:hypothetical protein
MRFSGTMMTWINSVFQRYKEQPLRSPRLLRNQTRGRIGFRRLLVNVLKRLNSCGEYSMATIHLPRDFKEFLKLLNAHQVEYLLIGGYAVGYFGYPRATADMDIWIAMHPANAEKIVTALKAFGFNPPELSPDLFLKEWQIIRLGVPPFRIEISTTISGVNFNECYVERIVDELDGEQVNLICLKHLKINKKASGRHQDLADLENLP